jgi:hypothetical protein
MSFSASGRTFHMKFHQRRFFGRPHYNDYSSAPLKTRATDDIRPHFYVSLHHPPTFLELIEFSATVNCNYAVNVISFEILKQRNQTRLRYHNGHITTSQKQ